MADESVSDENSVSDVLRVVENVNGGEDQLCCNPIYRDRLQNQTESNKWSGDAEDNLNSNSVRSKTKDANGFNANNGFSFELEVGGIQCDEEDRGAANFIPLTETQSKRFVPQLVFLDSDEGSSAEQLIPNGIDLSSTKQNNNTHEKRVSGIPHSHPITSHEKLVDGFSLYKDLSSSQKSVSSQLSSDSDLITDVNMAQNDSTAVLPSDRSHEWHCHDASLKLRPDKTARNQLITVSVLCFIFMVGEAVGKEIHCSYHAFIVLVLFLTETPISSARNVSINAIPFFAQCNFKDFIYSTF